MSADGVARVVGYGGPSLDTMLLQAARLWVAHHRPYYAAALYRCPVVLDDRIPTFATDAHWRIYVNPAHANDLAVESFAAELIHEVNHLLRDHAARANGSGVCDDDHVRWNLAADAEINDDLLVDGLALDDTWVLPEKLGQERDLTAEVYYARIGPGLTPAGAGRVVSRVDPRCGSGAGAAAVDGELDAGRSDAPAVSGFEAAIIRTNVAHEVLEHARTHGSVPGALTAWAAGLLEPRVDWRRVLAGTVRTALSVAAGQADYSYQRFSRRDGAVAGVRLPGMIRRTAAVAVVVDTSGSMSDEDLSRAFAEVRGVLRSASVADDRVTVLTVDTEVADIRRTGGIASRYRVRRGGTDMRVGIDAALRTRPRPDVVIVLSDGETPWPDAAPPAATVVLGLVGRSACSLGPWGPPPWMRVVEVAD